MTPGLGEPGAVPALRAGGQGSVPPPRRHLAGLAAAGWHRREGRAAPAVVSPPVRPPGAGGGVGGFAGSGPAGRVTVPTAAGWTRPPWDMPPHLVPLAGCWHCCSSPEPTGVGGGHVLLVAPACHCLPRHPPPHTTRVDGSPQRHPREQPRLCPLQSTVAVGTPAGGVRPAHSPGSSPTAVPPASHSLPLPPPPGDTARAGLVPSHPGSDPRGRQPHGSRLGWGTRGSRFGGVCGHSRVTQRHREGEVAARRGGVSRQGRGRVPAVVLGDIGDNLWQPSAPAAGTSGRGSPQPGHPKTPPVLAQPPHSSAPRGHR